MLYVKVLPNVVSHLRLLLHTSGQTIIEYPTLYFGSYEHTDRLSTLIGSAAGAGDTATTVTAADGTARPISVLQAESYTGNAENEVEEGELQESAMEVETLHIKSRAKADAPLASASGIQSTASGPGGGSGVGAVSEGGKVRLVSRELLCLEYGSDDDEDTQRTSSMPASNAVAHRESGLKLSDSSTAIAEPSPVPAGGKINSSNVADIVGSMRQFIDSTLAEADSAEARASAAQKLFAPRSGSGTRGSAGAGFSLDTGKGQVRFASEDASDSDAEDGAAQSAMATEEGNEDFLAALQDLADKDIDALRAIIAAAEAEEGGDGEDSVDDSSDESSSDSSDEESSGAMEQDATSDK
jgi:hypothetical protein